MHHVRILRSNIADKRGKHPCGKDGPTADKTMSNARQVGSNDSYVGCQNGSEWSALR